MPPSHPTNDVQNRREFLKTGSIAAVAAGLPLPRLLAGQGRIDSAPRAADPLLRELAMRALDAARAAGATYADVRLTLTRTQRFFGGTPFVDQETVGAGVRALVAGQWGFVSSPVWAPDEMSRLGRAAAEQARVNDWGSTTRIELGDPPPRIEGTWATPVKRDAFAVPVEEKMDWIRAAQAYAGTFRNGSASSMIGFKREDRTFASTDGSFATQVLHTAFGDGSYFSVNVGEPVTRRGGGRRVAWVSPRAGGWDALADSTLHDEIPVLYEEARRQLESDPIRIGRFEVVFDAAAMASIMSQSIGSAAEMDRVRGYEANAGGTSWLSPREEMLGKPFGAAAVTITADRTDARGAASARWDDEGVPTRAFPIVTDGALVDYATTREHAAELRAWYGTRGLPAGSRGCAGAASAMQMPLVQTPNLALRPAARDASFEDLVGGVTNGLAVVGGDCRMDFRRLTGQGEAEVVYEVKNGKLGKVLRGGAYLFRSPDFWKGVVALGGPKSVVHRGFDQVKGQPFQILQHTVAAVPAHVRNIVVIDVAKKPR